MVAHNLSRGGFWFSFYNRLIVCYKGYFTNYIVIMCVCEPRTIDGLPYWPLAANLLEDCIYTTKVCNICGPRQISCLKGRMQVQHVSVSILSCDCHVTYKQFSLCLGLCFMGRGHDIYAYLAASDLATVHRGECLRFSLSLAGIRG